MRKSKLTFLVLQNVVVFSYIVELGSDLHFDRLHQIRSLRNLLKLWLNIVKDPLNLRFIFLNDLILEIYLNFAIRVAWLVNEHNWLNEVIVKFDYFSAIICY